MKEVKMRKNEKLDQKEQTQFHKLSYYFPPVAAGLAAGLVVAAGLASVLVAYFLPAPFFAVFMFPPASSPPQQLPILFYLLLRFFANST